MKETSRSKNETGGKKIENRLEAKNKNGYETKLGGIVTWRNCNAPQAHTKRGWKIEPLLEEKNKRYS